MTKYTVQYIRQQRVTEVIEAETEELALSMMESMVEGFRLSSTDDESDDPGEIDIIDSDEPKKPLPTAFDAHVLSIIRATPDTCRFPSPITLQYNGVETRTATALKETALTHGLVEGTPSVYSLYDLVLGAVKRLKAEGSLTWVAKDGYTWIVDTKRVPLLLLSRGVRVVHEPINACNIPCNWDELG